MDYRLAVDGSANDPFQYMTIIRRYIDEKKRKKKNFAAKRNETSLLCSLSVKLKKNILIIKVWWEITM